MARRRPAQRIPLKERRRYPLGLRVTRDARLRLEAAADANGRSMSQEAEHRLMQSFDVDDITVWMEKSLRQMFHIAELKDVGFSKMGEPLFDRICNVIGREVRHDGNTVVGLGRAAKAIIEELRHPTTEMIEAGDAYMKQHRQWSPTQDPWPAHVYSAVIDAALGRRE